MRNASYYYENKTVQLGLTVEPIKNVFIEH